MSLTFLEIANNVAINVRLPQMTNCFDSSERNAKVIRLAIINGADRDIFRRHDWSFLVKRHVFATSSELGYYDLPADYDRSLADSFWNNTTQRRIVGPVKAQDWALYQNDAYGVSAVDKVCTIAPVVGVNKLHLLPEPSGIETISYYYVSNRYVKEGHSYPIFTSTFNGDDNTSLLDDDLLELAALYRTLRTLGLNYGEEKFEFTTLRSERTSHDGGGEVLNLAGPSTNDCLLGVNVPLTGMG